jgi:hypothetical protein
MRGRFETLRLVAVVTVAVLAAACGRAERVPASFPLAGVSARMEFPVKALQWGEMGTYVEGPLYHRFLHRCSGCHVAPSPTQQPAGSWPSIVGRMAGHVEAAGLLPFADEEAKAITGLLQRHAPRDGKAASQTEE